MPASSRMYERIEAVSAWYPVRGLFLGERPMSRADMERALASLRQAVAADTTHPARQEWARRELDVLDGALRRERGVYRTGSASLRFGWRELAAASGAEEERFVSNGLGLIDARTNPFETTAKPALESTGASLDASLTAALGLGESFGLLVQPRSMVVRARGDTTREDLRLERAYVRGVFHNVALRVGADEMQWGQSPTGAMFISGNAWPFPALAVGTDTPITLPWVLRGIGPVRGTLLVADLGRTQDPPHARLAGWQVGFSPWTRFELGVAVLAHTGGNGGPPASFFERVVDLFPVIDAIAPQPSDLQISNKLAGGNLRLRFPELSGLDFYYELQVDDFDARRLRSSLVEDSGHLLGLRLPLALGGGQLTWRAEFQRTSIRLYEHAQFLSGVTYRRRVIGNPLGPNAKGGYLSATWWSHAGRRLELSLADESRDPSQYVTVSTNPRDLGFRLVRVSDDPRYRRRRAVASLEQELRFGALNVTAGLDRAWRTGGAARQEGMAAIGLRSHLLPGF